MYIYIYMYTYMYICKVRMLLLRGPDALVLRHTDVTYQRLKDKMCFSLEMLQEAAASGWRRDADAFGPIDLSRYVAALIGGVHTRRRQSWTCIHHICHTIYAMPCV